MRMLSARTAANGTAIEDRLLSRFMAGLKCWAKAFVRWRIEQAALAALDAVSDRDLRDIGLARSEVSRVVILLDQD